MIPSWDHDIKNTPQRYPHSTIRFQTKSFPNKWWRVPEKIFSNYPQPVSVLSKLRPSIRSPIDMPDGTQHVETISPHEQLRQEHERLHRYLSK